MNGILGGIYSRCEFIRKHRGAGWLTCLSLVPPPALDPVLLGLFLPSGHIAIHHRLGGIILYFTTLPRIAFSQLAPVPVGALGPRRRVFGLLVDTVGGVEP